MIRLSPVIWTVSTQDISLSDSISAAIANPPSKRWEQKCAENQRSHVPYVQICTHYECRLSYSTATRLSCSRLAALAVAEVWWVCVTTRPHCYTTHTSISSLGGVCTCLYCGVCAWVSGRVYVRHFLRVSVKMFLSAAEGQLYVQFVILSNWR